MPQLRTCTVDTRDPHAHAHAHAVPQERRGRAFRRLGGCVAAFCGALMMSACSGSDPGSPGGETDTGGGDVHLDDTSLETGHDTGLDADNDAASDTASDGASDTKADTKVDSGKDASATCPATMPKFGGTCPSAGLSCTYGSFCPITCDCASDLKWKCIAPPCPPPPPGDGGIGPDVAPPPPTDGGTAPDFGPPPPPPGDGGPTPSGCEDGVPCSPSTGCGSTCSSPSPPGSFSVSCSCGADGVFHCTKTPC